MSAHPPGTRTGNPAVDSVLHAVETQDGSRLGDLFHYFSWRCTRATGIGGLPCLDSEPTGAAVEVIAVSGCEGSFHRKDAATGELSANFLRFNDGKLYAVLETPPYRRGEQIPGDHVILFANGQSVGVDAGGITYLHFACGGDAATWL
jgi:hypothetical protein